jgi:cellulose synthase/poly-beta-1,6-N-acetylglucosamine synthase-like glycosyltransferase
MQQMEQLALMLITGAGIQSSLHDMANGANMAFSKKAFKDVKGFEGNYSFASGDDMFLIEKMRAQFPNQIQFLKSPTAAVYTNPKSDWTSFLQQRLRWAGKNNGLLNPTINRIWMFIGIYHFMLVILFLLACFNWTSWSPFLIMLGSKWILDYLIIEKASRFFLNKNSFLYFIPLQILYTCYVLRLGIDMLLGRKGDWERRT